MANLINIVKFTNMKENKLKVTNTNQRIVGGPNTVGDIDNRFVQILTGHNIGITVAYKIGKRFQTIIQRIVDSEANYEEHISTQKRNEEEDQNEGLINAIFLQRRAIYNRKGTSVNDTGTGPSYKNYFHF